MTGQLERMRVFLGVADQKSFAAAARAQHLSTSVVTRYVSELVSLARNCWCARRAAYR